MEIRGFVNLVLSSYHVGPGGETQNQDWHQTPFIRWALSHTQNPCPPAFTIGTHWAISQSQKCSWKSFFFKEIFILCLPAYIKCMCTTCVPSDSRGQKSMADFLELESQIFVSTMWVLGAQPGSSKKEQPVLWNTEQLSSPRNAFLILKYNDWKVRFSSRRGSAFW